LLFSERLLRSAVVSGRVSQEALEIHQKVIHELLATRVRSS
jgi:histone H3/H4